MELSNKDLNCVGYGLNLKNYLLGRFFSVVDIEYGIRLLFKHSFPFFTKIITFLFVLFLHYCHYAILLAQSNSVET